VHRTILLATVFSTMALAGTPVPTYGTYFGGTGDSNVAVAVAVDPSGNVIVTGSTTSQTLPGTANAFQPTKATGFPDNQDVFVAKFDPTGQRLLWATFLGGDDLDQPTAIAIDAAGSIYVIGTTRSATFPVTGGAYLASYTPDAVNGFAAKISANGANLLFSTYLPGSANALAINGSGEAYMVGAFEPTVITTGALGAGANPTALDGIFLLCLNATGTSLVFGAYLGGDGFNGSKATSVALDSAGHAYVAGFTAETSILTTANALQGQYSNAGTPGIPCCSNGLIVEVNSAGSQLLYGTYFGLEYFGTKITSILIAPDGSLYFSGSTNSTTQATAGAYLSAPGASGAGFIAKLTPGSRSVDSFSYTPGSVVMAIGNQPETIYAAFTVPSGVSVVELSVPTLSLTSSFTSPTSGVAPMGLALAAPHSLWLALGSSCSSCSLGNLISANAFQPQPASSAGGAVVIQLTDISPTISFLGSSATGSSPFAAGQLISIYGTQLGPTPGSSAQENPGGVVTNSNGGTQVLFDGVAAPILYTGASQINTAIPCSVAGKASTQMVVQYLGASSSPFTVPLSTAAPGIFTVNGTGGGGAVVLNQDYSLNGPTNPAARGSAVSFYATGIGPTSPCVDGETYQSNFPQATVSVVAGVGNLGAQVLYAGQAPYFITGVDQINIVIPSNSPTGSVPLSLLVNSVFSPPGVTIAVK
jgi:uncharacterized protein (TIGR03437 family)